jgi:acetyl-CoA carboxylase carboxyl transferase subunit beta
VPVSSPHAREAISAVADEFVELSGVTVPEEVPEWPGYAAQLQRAAKRTAESESVVAGRARSGDLRFVAIAMEFQFMGGSMGAVAGARIAAAFDEARRLGWPVVSLIASGGARMQEGMVALTQMQRVAAAAARARAEGIPHVAVLRDPTTGGVWSALGAGADVVMALPGATVAFAGPRVRGSGETVEAEAPSPFAAEGQLRAGAVDLLVPEDEVRDRVALAVALLGPATRGEPSPAPLPAALGTNGPAVGAWEHVLRARRPERPRAPRYLEAYFERRLEISGDRAGGVDHQMLCGFGSRGSRTIAYAAQTGGRNSPAGFRTATRLVQLAGRLRIPVLTLIDTPGAQNGAAAEQSGLGGAIGGLFQAIAMSAVPVTSLVVGEGGSGGALALASPGDLWIVPEGYFAVIAPEAAAAILERDPGRAPAIAEHMALRPHDLVRLGIVRGVAEKHP